MEKVNLCDLEVTKNYVCMYQGIWFIHFSNGKYLSCPLMIGANEEERQLYHYRAIHVEPIPVGGFTGFESTNRWAGDTEHVNSLLLQLAAKLHMRVEK